MDKRILSYNITNEHVGTTIREFLKSQGYSHHILTHLKKTEQGIRHNGEWAYTSQKLAEGDFLQITFVEESSSANIVPIELPLDIVYEDEDLLVVNKPADMPIHPSQGNYENSLANACAYYFKGKDQPFVYRCVNRLDRDTTGLLIIAKNMLSSCILSEMMRNREIHRTYRAIATGLVPEEGVIDAPIARAAGSTIERCIAGGGEQAVTHYRRLDYQNGYSLVELRLETGRTHQIRVHMKYIGHPLPGDFIYNPEDMGISRQALHSYQLEFMHPITKVNKIFTTDLPDDMKCFLTMINK